ncbi:MAG: sugar ABC transporter permease, partial [Spirochaetota bacterium]
MEERNSPVLWQRWLKQWPLQVMALPAVIWLLIFAYTPMTGIIIAFKNYRIIDNFFTAPWAFDNGLEHFLRIFSDEDFGNALLNTLGISFLKLLIGFPAPIIFALLLNEL